LRIISSRRPNSKWLARGRKIFSSFRGVSASPAPKAAEISEKAPAVSLQDVGKIAHQAHDLIMNLA
jgi:hypothetical protein